MEVKTKAIVLSVLKYGETSLIVKCFTEQTGIKSYLLQGILKNRKKNLQPAYFQLLTQLNLVATHKNKGGLERIKEANVSYAYISAHTDIIKSSIVIFLAEVLQYSLYEEEQNETLFNYLKAAFQWLDCHENIVNFPLFFTLHLTKYLGFFPGEIQDDCKYFDLQEGVFISNPKQELVIKNEPLQIFKFFLGTDFDGMSSIVLRKNQRNTLLDYLMVYFQLHRNGFRKPKSLEVLRKLFDT